MRVCASSACSNVSIKIQFFEKVLRQQHCSGEQARYCRLQDIVLLLYGTETREGIEAPKPIGYGATLQCLGSMLYCIKPSFRDVLYLGLERKGKERKGKERKFSSLVLPCLNYLKPHVQNIFEGMETCCCNTRCKQHTHTSFPSREQHRRRRRILHIQPTN